MTITCRECGTANAEGVTFCVNPACGAYLEWTGEQRPASTANRQPAEAAERVRLEQRAGVEVTLSETRLAVQPGGSVTVDIAVHNSGTQVDEVRLRVLGAPADWSAIVPDVVNLYPDQSGRALLTLSPPVGRGVLAGESRFDVQASSSNAPVAGTAAAAVTVSSEHGLDAVLEPRISRGNGRAVQRVRLSNTGNAPTTVQLAGADHEGTMQVECVPASVSIAPYSAVVVDVVTRVPWRLVGPERTRQFEVVATPERPLPRATLPGQRTVTAAFRSWWPIVLLSLLALLVVAALVLIPQADRIRDLIDRNNGGNDQQQQQQDVTVEVPDVVGGTATDAQAALQDVGLGANFPQQPQGSAIVAQTDPGAGQAVPAGSTVTVLVVEDAQDGGDPPVEEQQ